MEYAKEANKEILLLTEPLSIEEKKGKTPNLLLTVPQFALSVNIKTKYDYIYKNENCTVKYNEIVTFLVEEI